MDKASRKRAEILDAAYKIFSEKGYYRTRIEDIAAELGMAQGLFYRYFRSKQEIFEHIIERMIEGVTQGITADAPQVAHNLEQYTLQLERAVDRLFDRFVEDPLFSQLVFFETLGLDDEVGVKLQAAFDLFGEYSASYIRHGVEQGFLRQDLEVKETALAFNAVILEAARRINASKNRTRARNLWKKTIVDLMIKGTAA